MRNRPQRHRARPVGLRLTAPDMIKIGELYRRAGVWNGQQIVPADWIEQSTSPSALNPDYGPFWWIIGEPDGPGYVALGRGGSTSPCCRDRER